MRRELMRRKGAGTDRREGSHGGRFSGMGLLTPFPVSSALTCAANQHCIRTLLSSPTVIAFWVRGGHLLILICHSFLLGSLPPGLALPMQQNRGAAAGRWGARGRVEWPPGTPRHEDRWGQNRQALGKAALNPIPLYPGGHRELPSP